MSISTQIQRLQTAKADIKAAISDKGVIIPDNATIDTYPTYVSQISSGDYEQLFIDMIEGDIKSVIIPDGVKNISACAFAYCSRLTSVPLFNTSNVTDMIKMFYYCSSLTSVPLFGTSKVTNMRYMFNYCSSLTSVPLFDTSNVTDMSNMFYNCPSLTSVPLFDTSKVTSMNEMFYNCSSLETIHMINIGANLDISSSTKFTREALLEIIGNLKTVTRTRKLTMGTTNLAKLTEEDKAIATNKGWTLA